MKKLVFAVSFLLTAVLACEPPDRTVEPGAQPASSAIAITADDARLVIAAEDHDQLLVVDRLTHEVLHRIDVGDAPSHVVIDSRGRAIVSTRYGHSLEVVNIDSGSVERSIAVGIEPIGMTEIAPGQIAVALAGESAVAIVDTVSGIVVDKISLDNQDPRAVALVDGTLFVTHMTAGTISAVDLTGRSSRSISVQTVTEFGPALHANALRSMTVSPDDNRLLIAHNQANADTVRAPINGDDQFFEEGGGCGYSGCAQQLGANTPAITEFDPSSALVVTPKPFDSSSQQDSFNNCFDCGADFFEGALSPPNFLSPFDNRFIDLALNNPVAIAIADGGRGQLIVNQGSKNVLLMRRELKGTAADVVGAVEIGNGAAGITLTNTGDFAYVWNQFDGSVTEFEVPEFEDRQRGSGTFVAAGAEETAEFEGVRDLFGATFVVVEDALGEEVSRGRKLFHDATDGRMSQQNVISCASCHPDGRSDNRTWQFTFGPRNTPQLGGGILETAPFHWPGDVVDIPDLNRMTVLAFMGGSGVDDSSMNAIGAFIDTIRPAPSAASQSALTPAQTRGQALFFDDAVGCATCHSGAHLTDNLSWDVGSRATQFDIRTFQTPVLHGLDRSGPYMHDGSATSLRDLVFDFVATDRMGTGSHLNTGELEDLAAFLTTL